MLVFFHVVQITYANVSICILWKLYHAILNKLCNDTISPELHDITHEKYPCVCVDMLILPPLQLVKNSPPVSFLGSVSCICGGTTECI